MDFFITAQIYSHFTLPIMPCHKLISIRTTRAAAAAPVTPSSTHPLNVISASTRIYIYIPT